MQNELTALGFWFVEVRIRLCERTEQFSMSAFEMQTKSGVECVSRFVSQDTHTLRVVSAFDFEHLLSLKLYQPRMCQEKRNRDSRHTVRREPFFSQPDVGLESNPTSVELAVKAFDVRLQKRAFNLDRKIADSEVE